MITSWILSNLHNYLKNNVCYNRQENTFSTDAYITSTSEKYHNLKWIPFTKDKPIYIQFYQFLHCKPSLFILHKSQSLKHCLYGLIVFFYWYWVECCTFVLHLTGDFCGPDRMVVLFSVTNSIIPHNKLLLYRQSLVSL